MISKNILKILQTLNETETCPMDETLLNLPSEENLEERAIQNDLFQKLPSEAKYIIHLIIQSPEEIFSTVGHKRKKGKMPEYLLKKYISKKYKRVPIYKRKKIFSIIQNFALSKDI